MLAIFALYSSIFSPLSLVFPETRWEGSHAANLVIDALYLIDVPIKLNTMYRFVGYETVMSQSIRRSFLTASRAHYVRTWFIPDLVSALLPLAYEANRILFFFFESPTPIFPICGDPISPTCQKSTSVLLF